MFRSAKNPILVAIGIASILAIALLVVAPGATLRWKKHGAHAQLTKLGKDVQRNLDSLPTLVRLPAPDGSPLQTIPISSYIVSVPPPVNHEMRATSAILLNYPAYSVIVMNVESSDSLDALTMRVHGKKSFEHELEVANCRVDDIDRQTDLQSLARVVRLLGEKTTVLSLVTHHTYFDQADRRGVIRAVDPERKEIHASLYLPSEKVVAGMFFRNPQGVRPTDVEAFLSRVQIKTARSGTVPGGTGDGKERVAIVRYF